MLPDFSSFNSENAVQRDYCRHVTSSSVGFRIYPPIGGLSVTSSISSALMSSKFSEILNNLITLFLHNLFVLHILTTKFDLGSFSIT